MNDNHLLIIASASLVITVLIQIAEAVVGNSFAFYALLPFTGMIAAAWLLIAGWWIYYH